MSGDGFRARADMQFLIDMPYMSMDGGVAEAHAIGYFLVQIPFRKKVEHFRFARREIVRIARGRQRFLEGLDDFAGNMAAHRRATGVNLMNRRKQLSGG